jgi:hypothetical protein
MPVQETFILPWLLWSAQYKIFFFLTEHYFNLCVPVAQQTGQAVVQGRLSLNVCLRATLYLLHRERKKRERSRMVAFLAVLAGKGEGGKEVVRTKGSCAWVSFQQPLYGN